MGQGLSKEISSFAIEICGNGKARVKEAYGYSPVFMRQYGLDHNHILSVCAFSDEFPDNIWVVDMNWIRDALAFTDSRSISDT